MTAGGEARVRILPIECGFIFLPFFLFFFFPAFSIFYDQSYTPQNKRGAKRRGKETESSSLHSISGLQVNI